VKKKMERIVYIRGKFKGNNKEMKEAYLYAKEMMTKYDLEPQWTNTNIEEIDFKEILEEMKKYVEPGIEEICDWESDEIPLRYIWEGEKILIPDKIFPIKVTHIYKKITPLDIPIEV